MPELTPEEKRRIYEEEKVRIEAQKKFKGGNSFLNCCVGFFVFAGAGLWLLNEYDKAVRVERVRAAFSSVYTSPPSNNLLEKEVKDKADKSKVKMGEYKTERGENYLYVRGNVVNYSSRTVRYWKAMAHFFDKNGNEVDSAMTNSADTLLPGAAKHFEIMHSDLPQITNASMEVEVVDFRD